MKNFLSHLKYWTGVLIYYKLHFYIYTFVFCIVAAYITLFFCEVEISAVWKSTIGGCVWIIFLHVFFTLPNNGCPQKLNHVAVTNTNSCDWWFLFPHCWYQMSWKGSGREWLWSNQGTAIKFVWKKWEMPLETPMRIDTELTGIWTRHLLTTST